MQKKDRAIVFTLSSNLTFAVACVLLNLKAVCPDLADEVVIIHDGISVKDKELLNKISPIRFIEYQFPIKDTSIFNRDTLRYFTKMVFAKFECLRLLDDYRNVLLCDYDVVIQKEISELFDYCESGIKFMRGGVPVLKQLRAAVEDFDMTADCVAAGTFVVQDHVGDYMAMYKFCYESLEKYAPVLYMPEQAIFDFMIQRFDLKICEIDSKVYSPHPTSLELASNAKIIHAYGQPKFWNGLKNSTWESNYAIWLGMGGSKYKPKTSQRLVKILEVFRATFKRIQKD